MRTLFSPLSCRRFLRSPVAATVLAGAAGAMGIGGLAEQSLADPLNPLDFPSLGTATLVAGSYTIDTGPGGPSIKNSGGVTLFTGAFSASGVGVFAFDGLTVQNGATITVSGGAGMRPVALLSSSNLTFAGTLNANGGNGGFGGSGVIGAGGVGGNGSGTGNGSGSGGSGGFASAGASGPGGGPGGGSASVLHGGGGGGFGGAGNGGPANGVQPNFQLAGGSGGGGGAGGGGNSGGGGGGGGGGAVELGALGALALSGSINANGGAAGSYGSGVGYGGGGGSGGAVLLHGSLVSLGGVVSAAGGASSGGGSASGGAGGGGRIAIQATANPGVAGIAVAGGPLIGGTGSGGTGVISFAQAVLSTANINCGSVPVGTSVTFNLIIQNSGDAGSFINGEFPAASSPFTRIGTPIFSSLAQNALTSCPYTFAPTTPGPYSQTLTFLCNAGPVSVTISGTGSEATGACCYGAACATAISAAGCNDGGVYLGDNTVCMPIGRNGPMNACCPADFNGSGVLQVADIFAFLNAWFAGCP